jgi:hypothetical protein
MLKIRGRSFARGHFKATDFYLSIQGYGSRIWLYRGSCTTLYKPIDNRSWKIRYGDVVCEIREQDFLNDKFFRFIPVARMYCKYEEIRQRWGWRMTKASE